jgi:hypothetical protein
VDQMPPVGIEQRVTGCRMIAHVVCLSACH